MIVNTNKIPSDEKTRKIIIKALEIALNSPKAKPKDKIAFDAVLLVLKTDQAELPF